jgi:hypothetical protein
MKLLLVEIQESVIVDLSLLDYLQRLNHKKILKTLFWLNNVPFDWS